MGWILESYIGPCQGVYRDCTLNVFGLLRGEILRHILVQSEMGAVKEALRACREKEDVQSQEALDAG